MLPLLRHDDDVYVLLTRATSKSLLMWMPVASLNVRKTIYFF
jgi:hypothetical protein